jgi:ribosomal protein S18 acetylase RimI-like enzyme
MHEVAVAAWPADRTADIDGWLWRSSGGGSKRANSVATPRFTGASLEAAIDRTEALYRAAGCPGLFQVAPSSAPPGLEQALAARGYAVIEEVVTMAKPVAGEAMPDDIRLRDHAEPEWREVYLGAITPDRRAVNDTILDRVPFPRAFTACRREGRHIGVGLCVEMNRLAIVECMATREDARRQGAAQSVLRGMETWALRHGALTIFLQAVADNWPAIRLYEGYGYRIVETHHYRHKVLD